MAAILVAAVLTHRSNLVEDQVVNTFAMLTPTAGYLSTEALDAAAQVEDFYTTVHAGQTQPISDYLSGCISRVAFAHELAIYDLTGHLDGTAHGSPRDRVPFSLLATDPSVPSPLPSEMACCLSFQSAYGADPEFAPAARPRARDRGRIYIGPLNSLTMDQSAIGVPFVAAQFRTDLGIAAAFLAAATGAAWAQWSRKNSTVEPVIGGWVDDAYDVQRRRGEAASVRTPWTV